ncbi:isthmin-1-like [Cryptotermes secundus]|uniref:isthmin-1-like n=1 Tax=Cryptotermes secundus TaxID=105785 RepID=UPI001454B9D7|nr:isthmin-1-like [Cryptotermes secundus]
MLREESNMPWAISGLFNLFRRLGPVLFTTGLLLVTCYGHDVNITVTSSPQSIISRTNPTGFDAINEGKLLQDNRSLQTLAPSRQKNTPRVPVAYRISDCGERGRTSNMKGVAVSGTPHQNIRHNKQRRRGKGRGRGKGKGRRRHNKSRSKVGNSSHQHSHIRRNLEKQVLVRNKTLELLGGGARILWANSGGNNTILPVSNGISSDRNHLNSTTLLRNTNLTRGSREKDKERDNLAGLPVSNSSSDTVVEVNGRTRKSHVPFPASTPVSGKKIRENVTKSRGISTFQFPERSGSVSEFSTRASVDSDRTSSIPVPVRIGINDTVMTEYQYDYDTIEAPGVVESSVWFNPKESRNENERRGVSSGGGSLETGPMQAAVGITLARVLGVLTGHGRGGDYGEMDKMEEDPCERWIRCKDKLQKAFLGPLGALPSCPCRYPSAIFYDDKIWDQGQGKYFRWRDVSGEAERLDVYKPGAMYCVRSLLVPGSASLAAQHCCYDRYRRLLTRGSGAGTPDFVSPEVSVSLHEKIDILPWRLCKGDFTRYNRVRPPNNGNNCTANPSEEEFLQQVQNAQYF